MELGYTIESVEGLPEPVAALYTEVEGKLTLTGITGVSPKAKVDEFRNTNIELNNKLKTYDGIDPAKYKVMDNEIKELKIRLEKTDLSEEQIEKIVLNRVENMSNDFKSKETEYTAKISSQFDTINSLILDGEAKDASIKHGIADSAYDDVIGRVRQAFTVDPITKKAIAKDAEGKTIFDSTGIKEITIGEWVKGLVKTAPHLFKESVRSTLPSNIKFKGNPANLTPMQKISAGVSNG